MGRQAEQVLVIAEIVRDAAAVGDATLARDFDEARFRVRFVIDKAETARLHLAVDAAMRVATVLGRPGTVPQPGYGKAMLALASTLDDIGFEPL